MRVIILRKNGKEIVDINRRKAIRERCLACTGWSVEMVQKCEMTDCPLHKYRSGRGKQDSKERAKSIRKFCLWCFNDQLMGVSKCPARDCSLFVYRKTKIDRSAEIDFDRKKQHIHGSTETIFV